ncbi:zinc finger C2HC domain-containing protein 1C [Seriola lalandi dorsalis]|uniref:zinc finger C2HC domain-containing protein 1C n=1 Tax=Seriola lalandi dorsalis TaxID=1841481 RepID=UPI000C6FC4E4|nr:zinc finger C2HC domain-containing protein 1C [Seriola lalandi dorsalis]
MSTYTRRSLSPHGQHDIPGQRQGNVYTQVQHGRRADGVGRPFPNKPVSHRRPVNPRTQDSLDLYDFEKITITKQQRGSFLPQEHNLNDIRKTTGSQHTTKDSHGLPSGELQMARAIHAKELMLQEKLWRVEEVIRQKIQRDRVAVAAGNDEMTSEKEMHDGGQAERGKAHTKTKLSEQHRREALRNGEILMQERRKEDVKQLRRKQDQRNEDRMKKAHEEEGARWKRREIEAAECPQSKRPGNKGSLNNTVNKKKVSGELNKLRWENVTEHIRGKGDEKDQYIRGKAGVGPQDGLEEAKEREQYKNSISNIGWPKEKKYMERIYKDMRCSYDEQDIPQITQEKLAHRLATETHRGAERKISWESTLPPVSSPRHFSRPHKEKLGLMNSTDTNFQLLPCTICNRKFKSDRLEKHVHICKKVSRSHRQVFNSYVNRTKGSAIEEFWKTHSRSKTPEVLQEKSKRQNHKAYAKGQLPAGSSRQK